MNKTKHLLIVVVLILGSFAASAQWVVDGEFRMRMNIDNGQKFAALETTDASLFFDQRSRLRLNYKTEQYATRFTLQDTRIWGGDDEISKTGGLGNSTSLGVYEAWVELFLNDRARIRIGRQEWNYNDMRLLGYRNWWTSGLSYDAILFKSVNQNGDLSFDAGFSYNNNGTRNGFIDNSTWEVEKQKTLNFVNASKSFGKKSKLSWLSVLSGKQEMGANTLVATATHGLIFSANTFKGAATDGVFGDASAYYQHGTDLKRGSDGAYKSISAYMLTASLGVRTLQKKMELSVGFEHLSGHDYSNTDAEYQNTRHSFDLLNGGRFPYYGGYLNHFIIQDSYLVGTKGGAYTNPYVKGLYKLNKKSVLEAKVHFPRLSSKVKAHTSINPLTNKPSGVEFDASGNTLYWQGSLGNYIDVSHTYKMSKEVIIKSGVSYGQISDIKNQMAYGYTDVNSKLLHGVGQNYFAWAMLIVKPTFFKSNKNN